MNSSQTARVVLFALWVIATLLLASVQTRVLASPTSRRVRYLVAWLVCTLVLGWLLLAMDTITGNIDVPRRVADVLFAALLSAAGLAAGSWWSRRPGWVNRHGATRFLALALIHGLVVLVLGFAFI